MSCLNKGDMRCMFGHAALPFIHAMNAWERKAAVLVLGKRRRYTLGHVAFPFIDAMNADERNVAVLS